MKSVSTAENQQPAQDGQGTPVEIRTLQVSDGTVVVILAYNEQSLVLVSDAAAQIALELLSASYAARAEMALQEKLKEARLDM